MENNVWNSFDFCVVESYVAVADINEGYLASVIGSQILSADYCKTSSISRTKSQNLNVSCLLLQWPLPNPLKPGVKLRMKM